MEISREIKRHEFEDKETCTATRCFKKPIFLCRSISKNGTTRTFSYCYEHGFNFAKTYNLDMPPKETEDVLKMDFSKYKTSALKILKHRVALELTQRPTSVELDFEEVGVEGEAPYVARLKAGDHAYPERVFFDNLTREVLEPGRVRVSGSFEVETSSIIEKRLGGKEVEPWERFYINDEGQEILIGNKSEPHNKTLVQYLKGEISSLDLLSTICRSQ